MRESGLAHPGNVLDQQMTARQQAGDAQPDLRILAQDDAVQLRKHRFDLRLQRVHWFLSFVTRAVWADNWPISVRNSSSRCWSLATISGGAFLANWLLPSLASNLLMSISAFRSLFAKRSSSATGSMRPFMGTSISRLPSNATAEIGAASPSLSARGASTPPRRTK